MGTFLVLGMFLFQAWAGDAPGGVTVLGRFGQEGLAGWEEKVFAGRTTYSVETDAAGKSVLKAHTVGSASGLFKKTPIDLTQTPFLNWAWKVDGLYKGLNEQTKEGDDYPARVYVVFSGGVFFWRTRALNYVWSSSGVRGSSWTNAYTSNARMVVLRTREDGTGVWYAEKRNIREDFRLYFGEDSRQADAVAIMTDADQSGQEATAWYGEIFLSRE